MSDGPIGASEPLSSAEAFVEEVANRRESVWGVLGTSITLAAAGLFFLLVLGGIFFLGRGLPHDGEEMVATVFKDGEAPFGMVLAESTKLPLGEVILRLERQEEEEAQPEPESPEQIVLLELREAAAARALFESGGHGGESDAGEKLVEWQENPESAWHTTLKADEIAWSRWRARYRIERSFREDGTWRDSARLNLTQPGRNLLLFAQYPAEVAATEEAVERVARTVKMLAAE